MSRVYGRRSMLNLPGHESTAAIVAELVQSRWGWSPQLQLSDCTRTVSFSLHNPADEDTSDEDFENDMHKLQTIIDACKELQKGMRSVRRRYA